MRAFFFCILLLLQNTHQAFLQIQASEDMPRITNLRNLDLDTETTFPIIEAVKIQLGEWSFWITLFIFAGVVFMAWKESCLGEWERTGAYTVFGALIFFTYWTIPLIIGLGIYCFRNYLFKRHTSIVRVALNGTEMTEPLLLKERRLRANPNGINNEKDQTNLPQKNIISSRMQPNTRYPGTLARQNPLQERSTRAWYRWFIEGANQATRAVSQITTKGHLVNIVKDIPNAMNVVQNLIPDRVLNTGNRQPSDEQVNPDFITLAGFSSLAFDEFVFNSREWENFCLNNLETVRQAEDGFKQSNDIVIQLRQPKKKKDKERLETLEVGNDLTRIAATRQNNGP